MPGWLTPFLIGLALGAAVAGLNHFILLGGVKKAEKIQGAKAQTVIAKRYGIRYITNILAMFLVYKNMPMLIGTVIGLTSVKNIYFVRNLIFKR